jgi:lipid-A-disaccharide synthase-like uncharacterized protein
MVEKERKNSTPPIGSFTPTPQFVNSPLSSSNIVYKFSVVPPSSSMTNKKSPPLLTSTSMGKTDKSGMTDKTGMTQKEKKNVDITNGYLIFSNGFMVQWGYAKKEYLSRIKFPMKFSIVFGAHITRMTRVWNDDIFTDNPLNTYITSLTNEKMEVHTALFQNTPCPYFWYSYGFYQIDILASTFYLFPSTSYSFPSAGYKDKENKGWVELANGFMIQWGYGDQETNEDGNQSITFLNPFSKIFGAQITKSNCSNNTPFGNYSKEGKDDAISTLFNLGLLASSHSPPISTQIQSITKKGMKVDTGFGTYNKSEYFWMAYGLSTQKPFLSTPFYSFPKSSFSVMDRSSTSHGWILLDSSTNFAVQWGYGPKWWYGPKEETINVAERYLPIVFSPPFIQVFGVQMTKSLDGMDRQWGSGDPVMTRIYSLSNDHMYVDVGSNINQKSEFYWIAYGTIQIKS